MVFFMADASKRFGDLSDMSALWLTELKQRQMSLYRIMQKHDLDAVLIVGNSAVGTPAYGSYRYFTDVRINSHLQAMVARQGKPPTVCCNSVLSGQILMAKGFEDIRIAADVCEPVLSAMSEQPVRRLGVSFDMLPTRWFLALEEKGIIFVDVTDDIFELRNERSELEVYAIRESAKIADAGYEAVCGMLHPGVRMSDLHAELDYAMKKGGAEEAFTLMSNGRFSHKDNQLPPIEQFSWPDDRVVREGDSVAMEITPKYMGHWTQLVRMVCVGEPHNDLRVAHKAQLEAINATLPMLRAGVRLGDALTHLLNIGAELGYTVRLPFGHIMGLDLDEGGRASLDSDVILNKNMTIVLHPSMAKFDEGIFWGDPYLITEKGGERLSACSTELLVL